MDHDVIRDGIEDLRPLPAGLRDPREQPRVFQSNGRMSDQGLQQIDITRQQIFFDVAQRENAKQVAFGAFQTDQSQIIVSERVCGFFVERLHAASCNLQTGMPFRILGQGGIQFALRVFLRLETVESHAFKSVALRQRQHSAACLHGAGDASRKIPYKIGQAQCGTQVQRHLH